jgi:pimeloyl-ACP methyl ester carboxylesterase
VRSPVMQAGPPHATEAVVFVHGNPGPSDDWTDLLQRVGAFARALAPDMPGYGSADKPRDFNYTIAGYADHLGAARPARRPACSPGGARLQRPLGPGVGGQAADAFASATLINTGSLIDYTWHRFAKIWRTPIVGELFQATTTRPAFRLLVARDNPRLPRETIDRIYAHARTWETKRAVLKLYRATPAKLLSAPTEPVRALDRLALVIWGTQDAYLPREQAQRQRQSFPSARVELLEGHGHWAFHEDPERVASLVVPFLREQLGNAGAVDETVDRAESSSSGSH